MEYEPITLSLWDNMSKALKSSIKYSSYVKGTVSDVNITDLLINREGEVDPDSIAFWSQLIKVPGVKNQMETLLCCTFKRGKVVGKMVHQIPCCRNTVISEDFTKYVANKIRNTPSLWSISDDNYKRPPVEKTPSVDTAEVSPLQWKLFPLQLK